MPLRIIDVTKANFLGLSPCNPYGCQQSLMVTLAYLIGSFLLGIKLSPSLPKKIILRSWRALWGSKLFIYIYHLPKANI